MELFRSPVIGLLVLFAMESRYSFSWNCGTLWCGISSQKKDLVVMIKEEHEISTARACRVIGLERSGYYYEPVSDDTEVEDKLRYYATKLPTRGCPEYTKRIRKEGLKWNHKRIERVYVKLGMNKRRRKMKRRVPNPEKSPLLQPLAPNITWSADFMHDRWKMGEKCVYLISSMIITGKP